MPKGSTSARGYGWARRAGEEARRAAWRRGPRSARVAASRSTRSTRGIWITRTTARAGWGRRIVRATGRLARQKEREPWQAGQRRSRRDVARMVSVEPVRVALTPIEAAAALGVSRDFFDTHVKPELRVIRHGGLVLSAGARPRTVGGGERGAHCGDLTKGSVRCGQPLQKWPGGALTPPAVTPEDESDATKA